jgi:hypothetical protein
MPIRVKAQDKPEYEPMEEGEYKARVREITEDLESEYGPQARFEFEIIEDEDYAGSTIRAWASLKEDDAGDYTFWPGTKLWDWVVALRGGDQNAAGDIQTLDDLVDSECRIVVKTKLKKDGNPTDRITEVLAPKKGKSTGKTLKAEKQEQSAKEDDADFSKIPF